MTSPISLVGRIDRDSQCGRSFSEVKEFTEKLLTKQVPQILQVVSTDEAYYTDHGIDHIERVTSKLDKLCKLLDDIGEREICLLLIATYCHDLGLFLGGREGENSEDTRNAHHSRGADIVQELNSEGIFHLDTLDLDVVKKIVLAHRVVDLRQLPEEQRIEGSKIRTQLLGSFLRIADACDCDRSRAPRSIFDIFYHEIPKSSRTYWKMHFPVTDVDFDPKRSAIVVSIETNASLERKIQGYRSGNMVKRKLDQELQSVSEVFRYNNLPLTRIDIRDFVSGEYLDLSSLPIHGNYILIVMKSAFDRVENLVKTLEHFRTHRGIPLVIEIRPPEGPIFIDSGLKLDVTLLEELEKGLKTSLDDDFISLEANQTMEKVVIQEGIA